MAGYSHITLFLQEGMSKVKALPFETNLIKKQEEDLQFYFL
jgi:hypothetical protein